MTRTEVVAIAMRLLVIWFLIQGLLMLMYSGSTGPASGAWLMALLINAALLILVATMTWRLAVPLAAKVLPDTDSGDPVTSLSKEDIERIALRVVGALLVVLGLSGLGGNIFLAGQIAEAAGRGSWVNELGNIQVAPRLVQTAIQILLGAGLFLGTAGLRRAWQTVRGSDQASTPDEDDGEAVSDDASAR